MSYLHTWRQVVVTSETDDHRHTRATSELTYCGRRVCFDDPGDDWPACHVCLPDLAHPLAAVWSMCERWDANSNAGAGEPR